MSYRNWTVDGLVFNGSNEGNCFALDAASSKSLWEIHTGGGLNANPISFALEGKQYLAIAAGQAVFVFGLN